MESDAPTGLRQAVPDAVRDAEPVMDLPGRKAGAGIGDGYLDATVGRGGPYRGVCRSRVLAGVVQCLGHRGREPPGRPQAGIR